MTVLDSTFVVLSLRESFLLLLMIMISQVIL